MYINTPLYVSYLLLLTTTLAIHAMEQSFNPYPLLNVLNKIIQNNTNSQEDTLKILKNINVCCKNIPSEPRLHIQKNQTTDPLETYDIIKSEIEAQVGCCAPLTFRLQGLQMILDYTQPFAH